MTSSEYPAHSDAGFAMRQQMIGKYTHQQLFYALLRLTLDCPEQVAAALAEAEEEA